MRSRLSPLPSLSLSYLTYDFGATWGSRLWQGRRANRPNFVIPSFRRRSEPADAAHSARHSVPSAIFRQSRGGQSSRRLELPSAGARRPLTGLLPARPGLQAAVAVWPIWAASTLRATGILPVWDPAGQGTSLGHGSLHIYGFTFTISFTITYRSGRRAPTLEGGGHSCPFVSSCGDAARERDRFNQSSRDRLRVTHGIRNTWGVIPHSMQPVQVLTY